MPRLILYQRDDCHLCDLALAELAAARVPDFESVFIDGDEALEARYGHRVPVLRDDEAEAELDWPFHATDLGAWLGRDPAQQVTDWPREIQALAKHLVQPCRAVSVSSHGAIKLGFGKAGDYMLAGKHQTKRYQVEIGTFAANWSYRTGPEQKRILDSSDGAAVTEALLGAVMTSLMVDADRLVITTKGGGALVIDTAPGPVGDVFYFHVEHEASAFFDPAIGWTIEATSD